ncbi:MAG: hypothetical protein LBI69_01425 [Puniceicoccales bacterium]|jgi:hypothetical protein|nr:hypothetical protein [Puniceicoccales bacterium]
MNKSGVVREQTGSSSANGGSAIPPGEKSSAMASKVIFTVNCALLAAAIAGCTAAIVLYYLSAPIALWIILAAAAGGAVTGVLLSCASFTLLAAINVVRNQRRSLRSIVESNKIIWLKMKLAKLRTIQASQKFPLPATQASKIKFSKIYTAQAGEMKFLKFQTIQAKSKLKKIIAHRTTLSTKLTTETKGK